VRSFSAGYMPPAVLSYVVAYDGPAKMETIHGWIKEAYRELRIEEPDMPAGGSRSHIASPALDGVFLLGKGFLNFDNVPYGFITDEIRKQHPEIRWAIISAARGSLLSLFLQLTVSTSHVEGAWLNPLPYLQNFRVDGVGAAQ
jgi:hypothetical protein